MKNKKKYFPLFVDISEKKTVIVGAGKIALRRTRTLMNFCSDITVIAPEAEAEFIRLEQEGQLRLLKKEYSREDILDADLVLAATDDPKVNGDIYSACKCLGILVNVCSDRTKCDFYFPGIAKSGTVVAGITASGEDHAGARRVREAVQHLLDELQAKEENHEGE